MSTKYQTYLTNDEDGLVDYLEKVFNLWSNQVF
jgi:hypothetical protein